MHLPVFGRLAPREWIAILLGFVLVFFDVILRIAIFLLPKSFIQFCYERSRNIFKFFFPRRSARTKTESDERKISGQVHDACDFAELCRIWGYTHEEHVVLTKDGYLLTLHRLPAKKGDSSRSFAGRSTGNPVVYLHHGLLMNSEIWVCLTEEDRAIPFVLVEQGYDVWLGNNRGNKYSKKSIHHRPDSIAFWDFGIDDFAWHDIPDSINYILDITKVEQLSYVGFSQGTAQAFAAFSINPQLNRKINVFIALAPALSPPGLSASIVDALMKASPTLVYLVFGRRAILSSALTWQSILYPPIFSSLIDASLTWLFDWKSKNISQSQKIAAYAHLYSFTSVKAVVHWFQILRSSTFVMYDDEVTWFNMQRAQHNSFVDTNEKISRKHGVTSYCPARFPTENIVTPIVLMYGDSDSLVDIDAMCSVLPRQTVVKRLHGYEHLDVLWGKDVDKDVIPHVLGILGQYSGRTDFGKFHEMQTARMLSSEKIADTTSNSDESE